MMTSSITETSISSQAALIATSPSLVAASEDKLPLKPPIGVRLAATITTDSLLITVPLKFI